MNEEQCSSHHLWLDWWCGLCGLCQYCGQRVAFREEHGCYLFMRGRVVTRVGGVS